MAFDLEKLAQMAQPRSEAAIARAKARKESREQLKMHLDEMRKLNEEWKDNLAIQRAMLIDKACKVIDDLMMAYISGNLSHDEVMYKCRKAMEE